MKKKSSITVTGDKVSTIDEKGVERSVSLQLLAAHLRESVISPPLLPLGTIYYQKIFDKEILLVEELPIVRSLVSTAYGGTSKKYGVSLPHVYFLFLGINEKFSSVYVFFRPRPLKRESFLKEKVFVPCLPNLGKDNYAVCLGGRSFARFTFIEGVQELLKTFWSGSFNSSMRTNQQKYESEGDIALASFVTWAEKTRNNANFVLSEDALIKSDLTLGQHLAKLLGNSAERKITQTYIHNFICSNVYTEVDLTEHPLLKLLEPGQINLAHNQWNQFLLFTDKVKENLIGNQTAIKLLYRKREARLEWENTDVHFPIAWLGPYSAVRHAQRNREKLLKQLAVFHKVITVK